MHLKKFESEVSTWPNVSVHPYRFGGREFLFGVQKLDTCILAGSLTSHFPAQSMMRSWRKVLPRSTAGFPIQAGSRSASAANEDLKHALWLMRLSYLRYALNIAIHPHKLFEQESEDLHLSPQFRSLLEHFLPQRAA
jgi:hypothetical protein